MNGERIAPRGTDLGSTVHLRVHEVYRLACHHEGQVSDKGYRARAPPPHFASRVCLRGLGDRIDNLGDPIAILEGGRVRFLDCTSYKPENIVHLVDETVVPANCR